MRRNEKGQIMPSGEETKSKMMAFKVTPTFYEKVRSFSRKNGISMTEAFELGIDLAIEKESAISITTVNSD